MPTTTPPSGLEEKISEELGPKRIRWDFKFVEQNDCIAYGNWLLTEEGGAWLNSEIGIGDFEQQDVPDDTGKLIMYPMLIGGWWILWFIWLRF